MPLPEHWNAYFYENKLHHVRMRCSHCCEPSTFAVEQQTQSPAPQGRVIYHAILRCNSPTCGKTIYVETTKLQTAGAQNKSEDALEYYPSGPPPKAHQSIPATVGGDWVEAQKAVNVGALTAAALMCRRVLYGVILDKKCKEHPLHEGISQLVAMIRPPVIVEEWLKEIKEDGHDAAHPSRSLSIPADNVLETMEYTRELLRFAYVEPFELKARLARKAAPVAAGIVVKTP
jgi:hypothetical protein